jgi:hypothetical protein
VVAAGRAGVSRPSADPIVLPFDLADDTKGLPIRPPLFFDILQTGIFARKLTVKVFDCVFLLGRDGLSAVQWTCLAFPCKLQNIRGAMDHFKENVAIRAFAQLAKQNYRELLAHRAFAQYLRDQQYKDVDEIIESARQSLEVGEKSATYDRAIDAKIPPSSEVLSDELLLFLESLPSTEFPN